MDAADIDLKAILQNQLDTQGVGCITVKDGQVFAFTKAVLERLLVNANSNADGLVVVFVKRDAGN